MSFKDSKEGFCNL